jgi:hypothetical protein
LKAGIPAEGYEKNVLFIGPSPLLKNSQLYQIWDTVGGSDWSALYQLSLPGIPEAARVEAVERSAGGEKITVEAAKGIAESHKRWQDKLTLSFGTHTTKN